MKMPSVQRAQHSFSRVPDVQIERSTFNRSHGHKTTFDGGLLVPVFVDEVLPGDTFNLDMRGFIRLATPWKPLMDNMQVTSFFFFCPSRILWTNFVKMMGEQTNPGDSTSYTVPQATYAAGAPTVGVLEDYFGLPLGSTALSVNALPRRAYLAIWTAWFRDQNLQNSVLHSMTDGPDAIGAGGTALLRRGKRHDYFTSCLVSPQKGAAVIVPLGTSATVKTQVTELLSGAQAALKIRGSTAGAVLGADDVLTAGTVPPAVGVIPGATNQTDSWYPTNLFADLSTAVGPDVNALRQAFQIQRLLERDARGGTRYPEKVYAHFKVVDPDARVQRPEYLGGGMSPVNIAPVAQTTATPAVPTNKDSQGNLAGIGTSNFGGHGFVKSFTEHGYVIGLVHVGADLTYSQGLERMWSRSTYLDFFWPATAHLGEQAVLNKEIYFQGTGADTQVFGYQERGAEYRYKPSRITGLFRTRIVTGAVAGNLGIWHLSQEFTALPTLNATFIVDDPPIDRVITVPAEPHFMADFWFQFTCARPMPVFSVPGLIDHF